MKSRFSQKISVMLAALLVGSVSIKSASGQPQPPRGHGGRQQGRNSQSRSAGQQSSAATGTHSQGSQMPGVIGTIVNGDIATGRLLIQSQQSGANLVIQVTANTQIMTQVAATVADLQVNDQVMIRGMERGNSSGSPQTGGNNVHSSASAGQRPASPQDNGFHRGGGQMSGNSANNSQNTNSPNGEGEGHPLTAGRVTSLNPLTIASERGDSITFKLPSDARVMKLLSLTFNDLKIGDRVMAMGQVGNDGTLVATQIGVNMDIGQNSRSGREHDSQQNNGVRGNQGQQSAGGQRQAMPQGRRGQRRNNG